MHTNCKAKTLKDKPCRADHYRDGWCYWHHPDLEEKRRENRRAGGRARSNSVRAKKKLEKMGLEEVDATLCCTLNAVLAGNIEPGVATAAATLARTITHIRTAQEFEARIAVLESLVDKAHSA